MVEERPSSVASWASGVFRLSPHQFQMVQRVLRPVEKWNGSLWLIFVEMMSARIPFMEP